MPIYEYQCTACGHQMEAFQKTTDAPLIECPHCQQKTLNKLVSAAGFHLKGTGWYVTDYRDKGKTKPANTGESGASSSGTETKTSETKTDTSKAGGSSSQSSATE